MRSKKWIRQGSRIALVPGSVVLLWLSLLCPPLLGVQVSRVEAVGMTVGNLEEAVSFYTNVLGFRKEEEIELEGNEWERLQGVFGLRIRVARLRLGQELIELTEYLTPRGRPVPLDSRSNDHWFQHIAIVVRDMDEAYAHLRRFRFEHVSTGPQTIPKSNPTASGIRAFYFKDPEGHVLELIYFPPGRGAARWQEPAKDLFLGIDHTAIVVADTQQSLLFYESALGLSIAGRSENFGTEQEHLNNVFGSRVRITGLRAAQGPGIEFLEYLTPGDGRPIPAELGSNDLAHWQTDLVVEDLGSLEGVLTDLSNRILSSQVVTLPGGTLRGYGKAILVRDPDGHALRLLQK